MIRELKGVESMSSNRRLMEPGGVAVSGFPSAHGFGWWGACPRETGKFEGLRQAPGAVVAYDLFLLGAWGPSLARIASDIWGLFSCFLFEEMWVELELSSRGIRRAGIGSSAGHASCASGGRLTFPGYMASWSYLGLRGCWQGRGSEETWTLNMAFSSLSLLVFEVRLASVFHFPVVTFPCYFAIQSNLLRL